MDAFFWHCQYLFFFDLLILLEVISIVIGVYLVVYQTGDEKWSNLCYKIQ